MSVTSASAEGSLDAGTPPPVGGESGRDTPAATWWQDVAVVAVLGAVFVALFVLLRQTPVIYDSIEYFATADRLETSGAFHRSLRSGLLLPIRAAQEVVGYSQVAFYTVPLLSGLGLLGTTYALGRMLFGRGVAIAAAVLVAFTPPVFDSVHQIWPDLPAAAVFTGAMAVLVAVGRRLEGRSEEAEDGAGAGVMVHVALVVAGLLIGWSYLIREFTVILFPVALLPFWMLRIPWRYVLDVAIGALAMLGFELAYNQLLHDDPLVRIKDLVSKRSQPPAPHTLDLIEQRVARRGGLVGRLRVLPDQLLVGRAGPGLVTVGAAALAAPLLHRRRRAAVMLVLWIVGYWVVLTYMSLDADEYGRALHIEKARYWYPILPPLMIGGCAAVVGAVGRLREGAARRVAAGVLGVALVVGVGLELVPRLQALGGVTEPHEYEQLRRWLETEGQQYDSIATTQRAKWTLDMFVNTPLGRPVWDGEIRQINSARQFRDLDDVSSELVLVDDRFFEPRRSNWREVTSPELVDPPADWTPVAVTDGSELVVYERGRPPATDRTTTLGVDLWALRGRDRSTLPTRVEGGAVVAATDAGDEASLSVRTADDLAVGDVVVAELVIGGQGPGNVVPFCFFTDATGLSARTDASSTWGLGLPEDPTRAQFTCSVPTGMEEPVGSRLVMRLTGRLDASVGAVDVTVVGSSSDWRDPD